MRRIWEYNREIQLIAILRDPADRAFSHWNMQRNDYPKTKDFLECLADEESWIKKALPFQPRGHAFLDRGFYSHQIRRMFRFFYPEQLLFLKYETFLAQQEETIHEICRFLKIDQSLLTIQRANLHVKPYIRKMGRSERQKLVHTYLNDIQEVERLLNWDCQSWKMS